MSNIALESNIIGIIGHCYLTIPDLPPRTISECVMTWHSHIPVVLAGNFRPVEYCTNFWSIYLDCLTYGHPAPSPRALWLIIKNFKYLDEMHQVSVESEVSGCLDDFCIMAMVQKDSYWAMTTLPKICMTSLTWIKLVYFISNKAVALSLTCNCQTESEPVCPFGASLRF
jgi:hypothetical protein